MNPTVASRRLAILDERAFETLADEWESLLQRSYDNRVFLSSTWFRTWWKHFNASQARIVTARDDGSDVVGILPLQLRDSVLSVVGDHNVADYMDGLAVKHGAQRILATLWEYALRNIEFERIELRHVPSTSPLISSLQDIAGDMGLQVTVSEDEVCPVAILCNDWEGYLNTLNKKQRHEIRRKVRRALDGVEWNWRTAHTERDLESDLAVFFQLHKEIGGEKAQFLTFDMRAYLSDVAATFLKDKILRLSTLRRDGVDVASTLSFQYRGRYMLYNSSYAPTYAAFSPGIVAVALTMQDAISARTVAFDFLSGDEPYKYQFGASNTHTCRVDATRL